MTRTPSEDEVVGPAIIRADYACDRNLTKIIGGPKGWRRLSPLQQANRKNQLAGGNPKYCASDRLEAGTAYSEHFDLAQSSGRNLLDLDHARGKIGGLPFSDAQANAIRWLQSVESHMGNADRVIIRKVCGEGLTPAEAIVHACGRDYAKATLARFREALDALCDSLVVIRSGSKEDKRRA